LKYREDLPENGGMGGLCLFGKRKISEKKELENKPKQAFGGKMDIVKYK
jgi:hypothetical protein